MRTWAMYNKQFSMRKRKYSNLDGVRDLGNCYRAVEVQWPLQKLEYSRTLFVNYGYHSESHPGDNHRIMKIHDKKDITLKHETVRCVQTRPATHYAVQSFHICILKPQRQPAALFSLLIALLD